MENMARKDTDKRVSSSGLSSGNLVAVLRHRSCSYKSDDRSSGTYYPTRDSHIKQQWHYSHHGHVSRCDDCTPRSRQS